MKPPPFTAHSVLLPDGRRTHDSGLVEDSGICQAALRDLKLAFATVPPEMVRIADLGCLEGGYSVAFARARYNVTGFEVRAENLECCEFLRRELDLPNLSFTPGDVRQTLTGEFEAVFCCGLLYHLDRPVEFLNLLGKITTRLLIVQSHYCDESHPLEVNEGRRGHWYEEGGSRWSSWQNPRSFWLTKDELLAAMHEAGFPLVFEQADYRNDILVPEPDRGMFVGVKLGI